MDRSSAGSARSSSRISDLDRAVAFYGDVLGLPLEMRVPGIAFFDASGVRRDGARAPEGRP